MNEAQTMNEAQAMNGAQGRNDAGQDRLYDLLPSVYRQRDAELGSPLRDLLRVIAREVGVVEDDIAQVYESWFIETCPDWAVPYLGDLIGYRPVHPAGAAEDARSPAGRERNKVLIPRREVANTLRYRRRKGTLALLELLARDVAGWPARAVELYRLVGFTQSLNHLRLRRGRTVDLHRGTELDRLGSPFDRLAHTVDVRRLSSHRTPGRPNLPGVALFLWRLRPFSVTRTPAFCAERSARHHFTFSVLGHDAPLFVRPEPETDPTQIAEELNVPVPIARRALETRTADYYGPGKSMEIWVGEPREGGSEEIVPVPIEEVVAADLSGWHYTPKKGRIAVDPELGRIAFPPRHSPDHGVWVSYQYGFSAALGGGEYDRRLSQPADAVVLEVGEGRELTTIGQALERIQEYKPRPAVIELTDSAVYAEQLQIHLDPNQTLQIRAARRKRPVIRLPELRVSQADSLTIRGEAGSEITFDGLLITGRGVQIRGELAAVTLRHTTLVPGWELGSDCSPVSPSEPSLELYDLSDTRVVIERSILGFVEVNQDEVATDPVTLRISDSIVDATRRESVAVGGPDGGPAHARLTVLRSTIFGKVLVHALELGENSIFEGTLRVARSQIGCLRFSSYVPGSRTPRRYGCQPDLAEAAVSDAEKPYERRRVRPRFRSVRYGSPSYARLSDGCAEEIRRGADDESEMGVYHDLFEPQRAQSLRVRLDEHTPAGVDAGLIFADQETP